MAMTQGGSAIDSGFGFSGRLRADQSAYFLRHVVWNGPHGQPVGLWEFDENGDPVTKTVLDADLEALSQRDEVLEALRKAFGDDTFNDHMEKFKADTRTAYEALLEQGVIAPGP